MPQPLPARVSPHFAFQAALLAGLVLLGGCVTASDPSAEPRPVGSPAPLPIELDVALLDRMAASDIVILGEIHDNPVHHQIQARIVQELVSRGRRPALVWEMVPRLMQPLLTDYRGSASTLGEILAWEERGWPDWRLYQPIAEVAIAAGLPMRAGDLDSLTVRRIFAKGTGYALGPVRQRRLRLDQPLPDDVQAAMLEEQAKAHCDLLPPARLPPMVDVQRARDAALAESSLYALTARGADSVVLITGAAHARRDRAVPAVLAQIAPTVTVFSIALQEGPAMPEADTGAGKPFDAVLHTAAGPDVDHCAALSDRLRASTR